MNPRMAELWPTVDDLIRANRDAARRAASEGDRNRALTYETAAKLLELGQR